MFVLQYHAFKNNCVQWKSSYLVLGDHAGRVGVSLAVKTYVIDGILCPHAIVHVDNLGDTRGRRFTFTDTCMALEREEYSTCHRWFKKTNK